MPSKSEPCGLSQMIAMRYGTVPIVRETGGLRDTVQPYEAWRDAGNGFTFANYASGDMLYVIREAVTLYKENPEAFVRLRERAMAADFSWARSANDYLRIYANITGQSWKAGEVAAEVQEEVIPAEAAEVTAEAPVKKTRKPAAKKTAKKEEAAPAEAAEEAPVKKTRKTAAKKETEKKETVKKGTAKAKKAAVE